jgi:hypothetical protein
MKYALYVLYKYYNESRHDKLIAFEKSKIIYSLLLGINFSTLSFLVLPNWILDNYFGYLLFLSVGSFYIIFCIFLSEKSITIPEFELYYRKTHLRVFFLYIIFSFIAFATVAASNFNPYYKRKHQPYVEEIIIDSKGDTIH